MCARCSSWRLGIDAAEVLLFAVVPFKIWVVEEFWPCEGNGGFPFELRVEKILELISCLGYHADCAADIEQEVDDS